MFSYNTNSYRSSLVIIVGKFSDQKQTTERCFNNIKSNKSNRHFLKEGEKLTLIAGNERNNNKLLKNRPTNTCTQIEVDEQKSFYCYKTTVKEEAHSITFYDY